MSRYLLDTHVWLWLQADPARLGTRMRVIAEDTRNELFLSAASAWEIAIKHRIGRLTLPLPPEQYVPDRMRRSATTPLPVEHAHALRTAELPEHHMDPFDRVLVAQAQLLDLPLVTVDSQIAAYDVAVISD